MENKIGTQEWTPSAKLYHWIEINGWNNLKIFDYVEKEFALKKDLEKIETENKQLKKKIQNTELIHTKIRKIGGECLNCKFEIPRLRKENEKIAIQNIQLEKQKKEIAKQIINTIAEERKNTARELDEVLTHNGMTPNDIFGNHQTYVMKQERQARLEGRQQMINKIKELHKEGGIEMNKHLLFNLETQEKQIKKAMQTEKKTSNWLGLRAKKPENKKPSIKIINKIINEQIQENPIGQQRPKPILMDQRVMNIIDQEYIEKKEIKKKINQWIKNGRISDLIGEPEGLILETELTQILNET